MQPWSGREEEFKIFAESVRGLLNCWSTLRICVEHEFGGKDSEKKKNNLIEGIIQKYRSKGNTINPSTISNYLFNFFEQKMNTMCEEDDTIDSIGELICRLCAECIEGETTLAKQIIEDAKKPLESPGVEQYLNDEEGEDDEDEEEEGEGEGDEDDEEGEYDPNAEDEEGEYDPNAEEDKEGEEEEDSEEYDPNAGEYDE